MIRQILLIALLFTGPLYAQESRWETYDFSGDPAAGGLKAQIRFPRDFLVNPVTNPGVIKQFDKTGRDGTSYVTVARIDLGPSFLTSLFKNKDGTWNEERVNFFWRGITERLDGLEEYEIFTYLGYPACNMELTQLLAGKEKNDRLISIRFILYEGAVIKLECGDITKDREKVSHKTLYSEVCRPFFESLTFE
ncbi:MAG: hypothetical protein LBP22_08190 [Deltaproteobacteria bacterium]|jgi:hypothetical protein|nr:hypothetical protein [Deltaproteobacteria bacterium]